jgi:transposase
VQTAKKSGKIKEKPLSADERAELEAARDEIRRLKMERDFLKKAAAWFASENQ